MQGAINSECHAGIVAKLQALSGLAVLLEPAARVRKIAGDTLALFRGAVVEHHAEEERDLLPALKAAAKGQHSKLDAAAVRRLVDTYLAHARNEEQEFLPLAQTIRGRNNNRMAALGIALHMRRAGPALMRRVGFRV